MSKRAHLGLAVAITLATGCALADRLSGMAQVYDLQERGDPAEATILEVWDTRMTVNDDPVVGFRLEVHPEGGEPFEATTKSPVSVVYMPQLQPGAVVPVLVDPLDRRRVALDVYRPRHEADEE
jgi:hypothetical protein